MIDSNGFKNDKKIDSSFDFLEFAPLNSSKNIPSDPCLNPSPHYSFASDNKDLNNFVDDSSQDDLPPISDYISFIKANRNPDAFKGSFPFTVNMFENLIDAFVPFEQIPFLLNTNKQTVEIFCQKVYNMDFNHVYLFLSGISRFASVKVLKNLYKTGNQTAIKAINENFLGLKPDNSDSNNLNITFVSDLNDNKED